MDESGDLGFDQQKKKTSRYFVVTCLLVHHKSTVEKVVSKTIRSFRQKELRNFKGVLHCTKTQPKIRVKLLSLLDQKKVSLFAIYVDKHHMYTRLPDMVTQKHFFYNYVVNTILRRIINLRLVDKNELLTFVASRRETKKLLNKEFVEYIQNSLKLSSGVNLAVEIAQPVNEKCLQLVDFASWAIYQKYERQDETYSQLVDSITVEEIPFIT